MQHRIFFLSVSTLVCVVSGRAYAQTTTGGAPDGTGELSEIVVTAERRSMDLQKVAVPIDVVSGAELGSKGISEPENLDKLLPGLNISANGAYPQMYMRGLGTFGGVFSDSSVLPSLDGVPLSTAAALRGGLYDLERVEVLKGPQGTLYGLNAAAGAVNVISMTPTGAFGGDALVETGDYKDIKFEGALNLPVTDHFALRAATQIVSRSGYLSDGGGNDRHQSFKLSALYRPTEAFSVLLMGDYTNVDQRGSDFVPLPLVDPSNPWLSASTTLGNSRLAPYAYAVPEVNSLDYDHSQSYGVHGEITWDLDFASLTVIPAYRHVRSNEEFEPGFYLQDRTMTQQTSVEARLASPSSGRNRWLIGVYSFDGSQALVDDTVTTYLLNPANPATVPEEFNFFLTTTSYALFGQDTFSLTDAFRLTAGLRYTDEKRKAHGFQTLPYAAAFGGSSADANTTGKIGVEYDLAPRSMVYANASNAVRPGGINPDTAPNTYRAEKLTAYTVGSKNTFIDGRLRLNAELYYWDDKDHQENILAQRNLGNESILTQNFGKVTIKGLDVDVQIQATRQDLFAIGVERNDAKINEWSYTAALPYFVWAPTTGCVTTAGAPRNFGPPFGVAPTANVNCGGQTLTRSPKWAGTASFQHTFHVADGATIIGDIDARFASRSVLATDFLSAEQQPGYALLNSSLTYNAGHWSLMLWGRNLSNKVVYGTTFERPGIGVPGAPNLFYAVVGDPRTYGLTLSAKF